VTIQTIADAVDLLVIRDQSIAKVGNKWILDGQEMSGKELLALARQLDGGDGESKYHNRVVEYDGKRFASIAEMEHYKDLTLRQAAGEICELECQPRYLIVEAFRDWSGKRHQERYYVADFQYRRQGRLVAVDVKGVRTDVYLLKRALFLSIYRHIEFYEVEV
jgi:hypothetical protein